MSEWIEVPAHRVLKLDRRELKEGFSMVDEKGDAISEGRAIYRIVRLSDNKVFRIPRYHRDCEDFGDVIFLEEI